ncbi:MAG: hypothetical protein GF388_01060 [Candidatus Aegiribacteria sp.]|nr:hypothetical protein [Candidatus Aegiribacteria sp.]
MSWEQVVDVQSRLVMSRASAEELVRECKDVLHKLMQAGRYNDAKDLTYRIDVYERVIEDTWPLQSEGVVDEKTVDYELEI